ncbi:MAG: type II secretion system F family protein [Anaerolineae bacterium]|jgi:tight adherence protein B|nr:type II secretion system F family protein [Anaerolineae bacterium]
MTETQIIVLGIGGLIVMAIIAFGVLSARSEQDLVEERLGRYQGDSYEPLFSDDDNVAVENTPKESGAVLQAVDNILSERTFGKKWRRQLSRADLKLTVAEFAALHVISMGGFFAAAYFVLFSGDIIFSIIAAFIGFFAPRIFVARKISQRLIAFETQLPDTLGLWVNALRSGYSVLQAMEAISRDAPEPTRTEFKRVVQEVQLGIDLADALEHMLDRVESDDLDLVITAVNIQREVGGNLSEILEVIAGTIRERIKLKGEIRVLTSQGRITGLLISFLPIGLAFFLNAINPGYMGEMFNNRACGWPMLGVGLALIGIGTATIQKIVDIEI